MLEKKRTKLEWQKAKQWLPSGGAEKKQEEEISNEHKVTFRINRYIHYHHCGDVHIYQIILFKYVRSIVYHLSLNKDVKMFYFNVFRQFVLFSYVRKYNAINCIVEISLLNSIKILKSPSTCFVIVAIYLFFLFCLFCFK